MTTQTITIPEMLARWDTDEGKPYKGSLFDRQSYHDDPDNIGCMCAQGQALHLISGMDVEEISALEQKEADERVMRIFDISRGQAILLRNINDSADGAPAIVITRPEKVFGDEAKAVLAFFKYIDSLDREGWQKIAAARDAARAAAARAAARDAARAAAGDAARDAAAWAAAGDAAWAAAAWAAARAAARDAAAGAAAGDAAAWAAAGDAAWAANEIQGHSILEKAGKPLFFLSMFGFKTVEALLEWAQ